MMSPKRILSYVISLVSVFCLSAYSSSFAQALSEVHIFNQSPVYVHPDADLSIFSDISQGGVLLSYENSRINFFGRVWQNESGSRLPDESPRGVDGTGGIFRFSGLSGVPQVIRTISSQPYNGFPNLLIDNTLNITAETGNLYVNNNLGFINGHLILDGVDVTVGRDGSGTITGYSQSSFIVTAGSAEAGGSLIRSLNGSSDLPVHYPVGVSPESYTPVSVVYKGNPQIVGFRVIEGLYNKPNFPEYVNRTWIMRRNFPDRDGLMDLTIQHNSEDEGIEYFRNRNEAYVTRYDQNMAGLWDVMPSSPASTPGTITDRAAVFNAFMNTRLNIGVIKDTEYFSKSVIKKDVDENTPVNIPDAISPNGDGLNDTYIIAKRLPTDKVRFEVYSRNQVLVYQHLDYDNSFDGTGNMGGFMGNTLPDGIYYYLISVNGAKGIPGYLIINR